MTSERGKDKIFPRTGLERIPKDRKLIGKLCLNRWTFFSHGFNLWLCGAGATFHPRWNGSTKNLGFFLISFFLNESPCGKGKSEELRALNFHPFFRTGDNAKALSTRKLSLGSMVFREWPFSETRDSGRLLRECERENRER